MDNGGGGRVTVHLCGWRCTRRNVAGRRWHRCCRRVVVVVEGGEGRSPADIRRKRRKTTVIGDNRFRPAWNEKERKRVGKRGTSEGKEAARITPERVLKWNHRWWTTPTMLFHGQTRNSNASRNCRVAVISEYFEKLELESERTRLLSKYLFLPVNVTIFTMFLSRGWTMVC